MSTDLMLEDLALQYRRGTLRNNYEEWRITEQRVKDTPLVGCLAIISNHACAVCSTSSHRLGIPVRRNILQWRLLLINYTVYDRHTPLLVLIKNIYYEVVFSGTEPMSRHHSSYFVTYFPSL